MKDSNVANLAWGVYNENDIWIFILLTGLEGKGETFSQRHLSNWVDADEDDDEGEESELCVQATPPYNEE